MILTVLQHTPTRVWFILAALVAFGLLQMRARTVSRARLTVLPLALLALSLAGVVSNFGALPMALVGWLVGVAAPLALPRQTLATPGAQWSPTTRCLQVPGSALPLALMVGLFAIKYIAGASLAMHPELGRDASFAGACSFGFGVFSGAFLARSLALRSVAAKFPS